MNINVSGKIIGLVRYQISQAAVDKVRFISSQYYSIDSHFVFRIATTIRLLYNNKNIQSTMSSSFHTEPPSEALEEDAMVDALAAKETMFKAGNRIPCPWPIIIVPKQEFSLTKDDIGMATDDRLGERSFEYGASWVEHYYSKLIHLCQEKNRMDLIVMLYRWYVAQFSLDYINDVEHLSKEQFLEASNVLSPQKGAKALSKHKARAACHACLKMMQNHDETMYALPAVTSHKISTALNDFYMVVAQQCEAENGETVDPLESMSLVDYMDYRTINAGGLMGFVRQTHLFAMLDPNTTLLSPQDLDKVAYLVGKNIALINDLYGLRKDQVSGEPNILLKHAKSQSPIHRSSGKQHPGSLQASIAWAVEEIKQTVRDVVFFYELHPGSIVTKYNIALGCISGNHGFHECSKRYELPPGFSWNLPTTNHSSSSAAIFGCSSGNRSTWCLVSAILEQRRRKQDNEKLRRWSVQPIAAKTTYQPVCYLKTMVANQ